MLLLTKLETSDCIRRIYENIEDIRKSKQTLYGSIIFFEELFSFISENFGSKINYQLKHKFSQLNYTNKSNILNTIRTIIGELNGLLEYGGSTNYFNAYSVTLLIILENLCSNPKFRFDKFINVYKKVKKYKKQKNAKKMIFDILES